MGCWSETCAITSLPILAGDKCVVVRIDRKVEKELFHQPFGGLFDFKFLVSIGKGSYDNYGWIEESDDPDDCYYDENHTFIDNRDANIKVFVNADAWNAIINHPLSAEAGYSFSVESYKEKIVGVWPTANIPFLEEFISVISFANRTRRDIFVGDKFRGMQYYDVKEYTLLEEMTSEIKNKIPNLYDEEDGDSQED